MENFFYEGGKYLIDASGKVKNGGDIDGNKNILIDKEIPEKFHEGIAVHEIEERKLLLKGHSYVYSHNEAQKKELDFYEKKYGKEKALEVLEEEEVVVLNITFRHSISRKTKMLKAEEENPEIPVNAPLIDMRAIREAVFEGKRYLVDNSEKLIGTLVDIYEKGGIIYIDRDVPERFFEGLALSELVTRKFLRKGMGWRDAGQEGDKAEQEHYAAKYGAIEAGEIARDELKSQAWKFEREKKELKEMGGHKVIYEKGEILSE